MRTGSSSAIRFRCCKGLEHPCFKAGIALCSSWRSLRSDAAVVKPDDAVQQENRVRRFYDCCALERRLRQRLQGPDPRSTTADASLTTTGQANDTSIKSYDNL